MVALFLCAMAAAADTGIASALPSRNSSPDEEHILQCAATGGCAELSGSNLHEIRGEFLSQLPGRPDIRVHSHGLRIANVVVKGDLDWANLEIPFGVQFDACVFEGPVDFSRARFHRSLTLHDCVFYKPVYLKGTHVDDDLEIGSSIFLDEAVFSSGRVLGRLNGQGDYFRKPVSFDQMKIGLSADFSDAQFVTLDIREATFHGPVVLENTEIDYALYAQGAKFTGRTNMADFYGLKVSGSAYFDNAAFAGPVNFILAHIAGNFEARGVEFNNDCDDTDLAVASRHQPLHFNTDFGGMKVDGFVILSRASFAGQISFRNATFQHLHLDGRCARSLHHTNSVGDLRLEGLSYRRIRSITNETAELTTEQLAQSWENLRDLLRNHAPYSFDIYQNLEQYFQREGQAGLADEVYIEGRCRERKEMLEPSLQTLKQSPLGLFPWLWNWILYQTVRYGREPERALIYASIIVLAYMRVHKILGWILVPIALAAFSGIIK
jgi:uncharacterized protein YjbI with pentapeptide repeats